MEHFPIRSCTRPHAPFRREHIRISSRRIFLQRRRGDQLLCTEGRPEVRICHSQVSDSLVIRGAGDLLPFDRENAACPFVTWLLQTWPGAADVFSVAIFFLFITCASQQPGTCLARGKSASGHGSLQRRLQVIAGNLAE